MNRDRLPAAAPGLLFAGLLAATWHRWYQPFQDHGREVATAMRLARGEVLYRDVPYLFGPLPPLLDAAFLRLFGETLGTLLALRVLLAAAAVVLLWRVARRLSESRLVASGAATLAVAACAFVPSGSWVFPYSVAALWGAAGTWGALEAGLASAGPGASFLAATIGGLAAGTKVDAAAGAIAAVAIPLLLRRPRREALLATGWAALLAAAAYGLPPLVLGKVAIEQGPLGKVIHLPFRFRQYQGDVLLGGPPADFLFGGGWLRILLPSLPILLAAVLLAQLPGGESRLRNGLLLVAGLSCALLPNSDDALHVLLPAAALLALAEWGRRLLRTEPLSAIAAASLAVGLAMLPALARQPLLHGSRPYAAFASPLALVFVLTGIARRVRYPTGFALFVWGLVLGQTIDRVRDYRDLSVERVALPRGDMILEKQEAALVRRLVGDIDRLAPPTARVSILPEGGFIAFLAGRLPSFGPEQWEPGYVDHADEERALARISAAPPAVVVLVNRDLWEFGKGTFGPAEIPRLWSLLEPRLRLVDEFGPSWDTRPPGGSRATSARVYVLRDLETSQERSAASGATEATMNGNAKR